MKAMKCFSFSYEVNRSAQSQVRVNPPYRCGMVKKGENQGPSLRQWIYLILAESHPQGFHSQV